MKNKALTVVLIVVVGIVWFQVFRRIKSNLDPDEVSGAPNNTTPPLFKTITRDTFLLNANYRDPFGGEPAISIINLDPPKNQNYYEPPRISVKKTTPWPRIKYIGLVRKTDSNNPLGIITIDGTKLLLRKGDVIYDEIQISSVARDSIRVKFKKEVKVFYR